MARLVKSRGRKPLAESPLAQSVAFSINDPGDTPKRFNLSVRDDETEKWFRLELSPEEAIQFVVMVAQHLTERKVGDPGLQYFEKRHPAEALRALADKLDAEK